MVLSKDLKIAICFGLIIGVVISFCSLCFAAENEELEFTKLSNFTVVQTGSNSGYLASASSDYFVAYVELEPGYSYTFTAATTTRRVGFADSISDGESLENYTNVLNGNSITFDVGTTGYKFFVSSTGSSSTSVPGTLTRVKLNGLPDFIDNIAYSLSFNNITDVWVFAIPLLAISVLFGFGFYFIKRILNKSKRAKGGV